MATTITDIKNIDDAQIFTTLASLAAYLLAGRAMITVLNEVTQVRHTYKVDVLSERTEAGGYKRAHGKGPWKVSVRDGNGFTHIGHIKRRRSGGLLFSAAGGALDVTDVRVKAIYWLLRRFSQGRELPAGVTVWRAHTCGRCGIELASEYRLIGYGPVCSPKMGIDAKAIFKRLAALPCGGEGREALRLARELVYDATLSRTDSTFLKLLPGIAGEYARGVMAA